MPLWLVDGILNSAFEACNFGGCTKRLVRFSGPTTCQYLRMLCKTWGHPFLVADNRTNGCYSDSPSVHLYRNGYSGDGPGGEKNKSLL